MRILLPHQGRRFSGPGATGHPTRSAEVVGGYLQHFDDAFDREFGAAVRFADIFFRRRLEEAKASLLAGKVGGAEVANGLSFARHPFGGGSCTAGRGTEVFGGETGQPSLNHVVSHRIVLPHEIAGKGTLFDQAPEAAEGRRVTYLTVVATGFQQGAELAVRIPRARLLNVLAEFRYLAESLAGQHGVLGRSLSGEEYVYLFQNADAASQFALLLLERWEAAEQASPAASAAVHFGECLQVSDDGGWVGKGMAVARRLRELAPPGAVIATEGVLDLLDTPLYTSLLLGQQSLRRDHVGARTVYRLLRGADGRTANERTAAATAEAWFLEGVAAAADGEQNSEREAACYREALRLRPDYPEAQNNMGVALRALGQPEEAEQHYREALRLRPDYADAHHNLAVLLMGSGRFPEAASHFEAALALRPDSVNALHGYANLLRMEGHLEGAGRRFRDALRLRPGSTRLRNDYAILLEDMGQFEEAARQYRQAIHFEPEATCHYNYALLLERMDSAAEAEEQYQAAIGLWPQYAEAHNNLGVLLHARGDAAGAERHYREAMRLRPDDAEVHYNFGLLRQGQQTAATGGQRPSPDRERPDGLSRREVEVLRLVAAGHSNREIAETLVLSVHTVERHVANIYRKVGARGRAQAVLYAIGRGLQGSTT